MQQRVPFGRTAIANGIIRRRALLRSLDDLHQPDVRVPHLQDPIVPQKPQGPHGESHHLSAGHRHSEVFEQVAVHEVFLGFRTIIVIDFMALNGFVGGKTSSVFNEIHNAFIDMNMFNQVALAVECLIITFCVHVEKSVYATPITVGAIVFPVGER